jgi:hypothetical protein
MEHDVRAEPVQCLYPGCTEMAVPQHKHGGPPPRYCANEDHNAGSAFQALKEQGAAVAGTKPSEGE